MNSPMKDASSMKPAVGAFAVVESEQAAGRLDYQLAELIEFVWACEAAAAQADPLIAQSLYAIATALSIFDTRISLAAIVLIQLNYALASGLLFLHRL